LPAATTDQFRLKERSRGDQLRQAIAKSGTFIVTFMSEGEALPESRRAHLVVGFKPWRV